MRFALGFIAGCVVAAVALFIAIFRSMSQVEQPDAMARPFLDGGYDEEIWEGLASYGGTD